MVEVKPEDIKEVETVIRKYVWTCPICGKTISSYTRAMTLKYAKLHMTAKHLTTKHQGGYRPRGGTRV